MVRWNQSALSLDGALPFGTELPFDSIRTKVNSPPESRPAYCSHQGLRPEYLGNHPVWSYRSGGCAKWEKRIR
jgi:hypothetical protein